MNRENVLKSVQEQYGAVARSELSNEAGAVRAVAEAFGYSAEDLASLPPQANMGLSCGNPLALAALQPGEVVVDLGCGGGLDVLLAAKRVGPTGRAIGIDMTPEMLERARSGAAQVGLTNVEFHLANIDQLPLPSASVDCVLSNCVINLAPNKFQVFREILRVLKPGGRVAISDIALRQTLPAEIAGDLHAYVGCIAGAVLIDDYALLLRDAGFQSVVVTDTGADLNVYAQASGSGCCSAGEATCCLPSEPVSDEHGSPQLHDKLATLLRQFDANAYAASVRIHAVKAAQSTALPSIEQDRAMKTIQIYDRPMCCSTGICGPSVDPALPRFAADLDWLRSQGHQVERYNLAQQPMAFAQNAEVHGLLATHGTDCLPLIVVGGRIVSRGEYPSRERLAAWTNTAEPVNSLPLVANTSCCQGTKCC